MLRWISLMARHGGDGGPMVWYTPQFFIWLRSHTFMIEDFPYAGVNFRGDLDTSLPRGTDWDTSSKRSHFEFLCYLIFI